MKAQKVRDLDTAELQQPVAGNATSRCSGCSFQMSMGQIGRPEEVCASMKKDRARMLTILRERELRGRAAEAGEERQKKD